MKNSLVATQLTAAGLAALIALSGCGASDDPATPGSTTSIAATGSAAASAGKVSANTASESDIAAALQAAGVSNSQRWAREVVEYRPYDTSDANLTKLRQNLAKYNPGEDTVNKIVSTLQP